MFRNAARTKQPGQIMPPDNHGALTWTRNTATWNFKEWKPSCSPSFPTTQAQCRRTEIAHAIRQHRFKAQNARRHLDCPACLRALPTGQTKCRVQQTYLVPHSPGNSEPDAPPPSPVNITSDSLRVASVSESPAQCERGMNLSSAQTKSTPRLQTSERNSMPPQQKLYVQKQINSRRNRKTWSLYF